MTGFVDLKQLTFFPLLLFTLALASCAGSYNKKEIVHHEFFTDIKEDNSKLFVYIVNFKLEKARKRSPLADESRTSNRNGQGTQSRAKARIQDGKSNRADMEETLIISLEEKLASTGYCREGYFILNQYLEFGNGEIRGECRESANKVDKAIFGKQKRL